MDPKVGNDSFFIRMFSENPTASSQRVIGVLAFLSALGLAVFDVKAYYEFLWFTGAMFGLKETRKAIDSLKKASQARSGTVTVGSSKEDTKEGVEPKEAVSS